MQNFKADDIEVTGYPEAQKHGMLTGAIPKGIKVTHKASGIVVICDKHRHQYQNRDEAFVELDAKLEELKKEL